VARTFFRTPGLLLRGRRTANSRPQLIAFFFGNFLVASAFAFLIVRLVPFVGGIANTHTLFRIIGNAGAPFLNLFAAPNEIGRLFVHLTLWSLLSRQAPSSRNALCLFANEVRDEVLARF